MRRSLILSLFFLVISYAHASIAASNPETKPILNCALQVSKYNNGWEVENTFHFKTKPGFSERSILINKENYNLQFSYSSSYNKGRVGINGSTVWGQNVFFRITEGTITAGEGENLAGASFTAEEGESLPSKFTMRSDFTLGLWSKQYIARLICR